MIDRNLLNADLRLSTLFLDFNSFFASVEQQDRAELRDRPMIVVPVYAETTSAIAASYEAKRLGIKTGTSVRDARLICPDIQVVQARPRIYKAYHEAIREVAQHILPEDKVHSIDEMSYRLLGEERKPENAVKLALKMKEEIQSQIGRCLTSSIGIAPNRFLAKIATEVEKPNGLVVLEAKDLPGRLVELKLTDLTGINVRMARRLNAAMIFTIKDLFKATRHELGVAFGSVVGERWWYLLRGVDLVEDESPRKSLSHSHVLAPNLRTDSGVREVMLRLIQKASARLRSESLYATEMKISVKGYKRSWEMEVKLSATHDTLIFNENFFKAWESRSFEQPRQVGVVFYGLRKSGGYTPSLFDSPELPNPNQPDRGFFEKLDCALDEVNSKFGKNKVFLAGMNQAKDAAEEKIAFNKTWLFSEGKADNDWQSKFRGMLNRDPE